MLLLFLQIFAESSTLLTQLHFELPTGAHMPLVECQLRFQRNGRKLDCLCFFVVFTGKESLGKGNGERLNFQQKNASTLEGLFLALCSGAKRRLQLALIGSSCQTEIPTAGAFTQIKWDEFWPPLILDAKWEAHE